MQLQLQGAAACLDEYLEQPVLQAVRQSSCFDQLQLIHVCAGSHLTARNQAVWADGPAHLPNYASLSQRFSAWRMASAPHGTCVSPNPGSSCPPGYQQAPGCGPSVSPGRYAGRGLAPTSEYQHVYETLPFIPEPTPFIEPL
jgi:hypothetical protein